jgi:hypothetical protein
VRLADALQRARSMTFDQCAAAYIDTHRSGWKNAKHAEQWKSTLATYASPVIGALPIADVDTDLIVKVLSPIWGTRTETATRVRGRIESILDWATVSRFRQGDNPARWRGHLENLLANPNRIAPVRIIRPCRGARCRRSWVCSRSVMASQRGPPNSRS